MAKEGPIVSVLVPVYGVERYIAECARSLFCQTWRNVEYVFVDDCSPDRSIEVLQQVIAEYPECESQVRIVRQDRNRGLGAARKRAVEESHGEYLIHVDSDDRITPDAIEKLVATAVATSADITDGAFREFSDTGSIGAAVLPPHTSKESYLKRMLLQNIVRNNIWGRLYRRSLYTANGINSIEGVDYGEDFGIVPRLMLHAKRAYIDDVVYYYRNSNAASYTHRRTPKQDHSLLMANATVYHHFTENDTDHRYTRCLDMGMVNIYRYARRNSLPQADIDAALGSPLSSLAPRLCRKLFASPLPFAISDCTYRLLRKLTLFFAI